MKGKLKGARTGPTVINDQHSKLSVSSSPLASTSMPPGSPGSLLRTLESYTVQYEMTHLSITFGTTTWLEPVSEDEYQDH